MKEQTVIYTKDIPEYKVKASKIFKKNGKIERNFHEEESLKLQYELVKLQKWIVQ
jgi:hypothetical protein